MANTLVQFRVDESTRVKATEICEKIGIDVPTYMRICMSRLVKDGGIPFPMKIDKLEASKGYNAMMRASKTAEEYGIADMSLEEINAEIAEARK